jgi:hypothetical protein
MYWDFTFHLSIPGLYCNKLNQMNGTVLNKIGMAGTLR